MENKEKIEKLREILQQCEKEEKAVLYYYRTYDEGDCPYDIPCFIQEIDEDGDIALIDIDAVYSGILGQRFSTDNSNDYTMSAEEHAREDSSIVIDNILDSIADYKEETIVNLVYYEVKTLENCSAMKIWPENLRPKPDDMTGRTLKKIGDSTYDLIEKLELKAVLNILKNCEKKDYITNGFLDGLNLLKKYTEKLNMLSRKRFFYVLDFKNIAPRMTKEELRMMGWYGWSTDAEDWFYMFDLIIDF